MSVLYTRFHKWRSALVNFDCVLITSSNVLDLFTSYLACCKGTGTSNRIEIDFAKFKNHFFPEEFFKLRRCSAIKITNPMTNVARTSHARS